MKKNIFLIAAILFNILYGNNTQNYAILYWHDFDIPESLQETETSNIGFTAKPLYEHSVSANAPCQAITLSQAVENCSFSQLSTQEQAAHRSKTVTDYQDDFNRCVGNNPQNITEARIQTAQQFNYYQFPNFIDWIKDWPETDAIIQSVLNKLNTDKQFSKKVNALQGFKKGDFANLITHWAQGIGFRNTAKTEKQSTARQIARSHDAQKLQNISLQWQKPNSEEQKTFLYNRYKDRASAYNQAKKNPQDAWKMYTLSADTEELLQNNQASFRNCYGNPLQQQIHKELVATIEQLATIKQEYRDSQDVQMLITQSLECVKDANVANQTGLISYAAPLSNLGTSLSNFASIYGKATGRGFKKFITRTVHIIISPRQTVNDLYAAAKTVGYCLGNVIVESIELGNLYFTDSDEFHTKTAQLLEQCKHVIKQGTEYYKSLPPGAATEEVVAALCEFIIPGKALKIAHSLAKASTVQTGLKNFNKLNNIAKLSPKKYVKRLHQSPAGVLLSEAYSVAQAKVNTLVNAARHAKKYVCNDAQHVKKHLFIPKHIRPFLPTKTEIDLFSQKFNGVCTSFVEIGNKPITFAFEHFLGIEMRCEGKLSHKLHGFHHDPLGAIRRNGILKLTDIKQHAHGFYEATVWYKGKSKFSGFFPDAWSRERVMQAILEAYDNKILIKINKKGVCEFVGKIAEGFDIKIIVDPTGKVITTYPVF